MSRKVLILDTSVLCCWLKVPGKETAGPVTDRWTHDRIDELLTLERAAESTFVLPIATLIETGNHIAQAAGDRYNIAKALGDHLRNATEAATPWAAFTDQTSLWESENLRSLAESWPTLAAGGMTIGDATIKLVAEYYASANFKVEILTGDEGLKAYQPVHAAPIPRRRR